MSMLINQLEKNQLEEAVELLVLSFGESTRDSARADLLASFADYPYKPKTFTAWLDGRLVGLVQSLSAYIHPNTQAFAWLATHPGYRKQGIATEILYYAEQDVINLKFKNSDGTFLLVSACEPAFYEKLGYTGDLRTHDGAPLMVKHHRS